jgi:hypothetical protein
MTKFLARVLAFALVCAAALAICALRAAPQVSVSHSQGILHGFLILRSEEGEAIADADVSQIERGERVTAHRGDGLLGDSVSSAYRHRRRGWDSGADCGKQPPDSHVWFAQAEVPILVKSEGPVLEGRPIWPLEMASPVWPKGGSEESKQGR